MKNFNKRGIALLITLLFIMLITFSIGVGLNQVNEASSYVKKEKFLFQTSSILDDVLTIFKTSKEMDDINSSEDFNAFLSQASFIPFEVSGIKVSLHLQSARSRFNINSLMNKNNTVSQKRVDSLKQYLNRYMINVAFVDILLDAMGGIKEDLSYNSEIFVQKPYLYRDYIVSYKHFSELSEYYENYYNDDSLKNVDFKQLFFYSDDRSYTIDLNYATALVWEMMIGCDKSKAIALSEGYYDSFESIGLSDEELNILRSRFKVSFFEPYIDVLIKVVQDDLSAKIRFEYDMKNKKGSNFVYEI